MRILLTNDDGIMAPGILAMRRALAEMGDVTVVAPTTPQSAIGHAITLTVPIRIHRVTLGDGAVGYGVEGRPADCVKLAVLELMPERPELVVSGVNLGANVGINVLYSGTVAAAVEAAFYGIPAVAASVADADPASCGVLSGSFWPSGASRPRFSTSTCPTFRGACRAASEWCRRA